MRDAFSGWDLVDIVPLVLGQRMLKDAQEIADTEQAARIADAGHLVVPRVLRPGVVELELAAEVEMALRRAGHEGHLPLRRPGGRGDGVLVASGENLSVRGGHGLVVTGAGMSPAAPYGPSLRQVRPGDLVMVDLVGTHQGYCCDEARVYVVGRATAKQQALFEVALAAQEATLQELRPGTPVAAALAAAEEIVAPGAPPHFGPGELILPGFVGHGVGLEVDEPPVLWDRSEVTLETGMVLAVELELSAPQAGLMIKVEDTVVIEEDGRRVLTAAPRELVEVLSEA
jgi:Xaa-Pro aminopeptidase